MYLCGTSIYFWKLFFLRYLDIAAETDAAVVWNLEFITEDHLQVISFMSYDLPGAFYIDWEVLGIVWRLDRSHISMNGATTSWSKIRKSLWVIHLFDADVVAPLPRAEICIYA